MIIIKSESSGLIDEDAPIEASHQPRLTRISALLFSDGVEICTLDTLIQPEGFTIPPAITKINGIKQDMAAMFGLPLKVALSAVSCMTKATRSLICWSDYDHRIPGAEITRMGVKNSFNRPLLGRTVLNGHALHLCKILKPDARNPDDYRSPRIEEAAKMLCDIDHKPHSGLEDCRVMLHIHNALKRAGVLP